MRLRIIGCIALLAAAGCGNNDARVERDVRAACDQIQPGVTTIRQADTIMEQAEVFLGCESNLQPIPGFPASACGEPASVCHIRWQFQSSADCGPSGGCAYVCDARVQDSGSGAPSSVDAVICARQFLKNQPYYY